MKNLVTISAVILMLGACSERTGEQLDQNAQHIRVYTDPETGCQYLIYDRKYGYAGMGGITARMDADGNQICE